jgi:16S rRNA G966 N2-methylase RsmD
VVGQVPVSSLKPYADNPRTHTKKQIRQIAESIRTFGWTNPVLVDANDGIVAGHGRVEAAKLLGIPTVPVLRLEDLSEAQLKAYIIADNKLAELAGWDEQILAKELQLLTELNLDFDIEVTGFEMGEIDVLIEGQSASMQPDPADDIPEIDETRKPVSLLGACGNALCIESYGLLMGRRRAQMVFTDPPYNVSIKGILAANGRVTHPEFVMASGEMSSEEFAEFLARALSHHASYSQQGALHFVCMDWRHLGELLRAGEAVYSELKNLCVWKKTNAGMGSFYRSQHELVFVYRHGDGPTINNVQLGSYGRNRTNVWEYAGQNVPTSERMQALAMHPTVKPVRLVADAILDCSKRGGLILDGFAGSGTTIIAAEQTGRGGAKARPLPPTVKLPQPSAEGSSMGRSKINRDDYAVGYGRRPQHTRFKPGRSGNPKGRSKGTKNLKTDLMEELSERITVSEGGKPKKLSKQRALLKSLLAKAIAKGDARAANILINLILRVLEISAEEREEDLISEDDLAILDDFIARQKPRTAPKARKRVRKRVGAKP